ncbi:MAG TPA: AI-2E family transporter, partial [Solirubrobacteraceae bacterium]
MSEASEQGPEASPPTREEKRLAEESRPAGAHDEPPRAVVPRWIQLVVLPLGLLAIWELGKVAGQVLVLFIVAGLIALILNPAVAFLQRRRLPRGLAVLAVYLGFFLGLGGIGVLVANPISNQVQKFANNLPHLVDEANENIATFQEELDEQGVHIELVKQGKTALQTIQDKVAKSASKLASSSASILTEAAGAVFDLVLIFVLSVYMLLYGEQIGALARRLMPTGDGT